MNFLKWLLSQPSVLIIVTCIAVVVYCKCNVSTIDVYFSKHFYFHVKFK